MTNPIDPNPLIEMMRRIRFEIFERMERGTLNYKRDIGTLHKHLELAQEMQNPKLIGQTHNMIGIIDQGMGHFVKAEKHLVAAYEIVEPLGEYKLMASIQNNLGEVYRRTYRLKEAAAVYENAQPLFEKAGDQVGLCTAQCNVGLTWLAMGNYTNAESWFRSVIEATRNTSWDHIATLIEAHNGLAEIHLQRHEYDVAWAHTDESERLAIERDFKIALALTHLTRAHVAENDPKRRSMASGYYRMARQGLRASGTPILLARTLLEEARYQGRHGQPDDSVRLASESLGMFQELGLEEETRLAQTILNNLAAIDNQ